MPYARPTLADLRAQQAADLAADVAGADPLLPVSNLGIMADMQSGGLNGLYGYLDYIAKQSVPFTARDEAFQGWAALKGAQLKPATAATGQWTAAGGTPTTVLPALTPVSRGDGVAYQTTADATVAGDGTIAAPVVALVAGAAGTLATGMALVLGRGVAGIPSTGAAVAGTPGVDVEDFETFRTRVLAIYASPPQGGAIGDYPEWAEEVAGVTRAWCIPNGKGAGTVVVYAMMDVAEANHAGFPQGVGGCAAAETRDTPATLDLLAIANWIFTKQPVTALVYVLAPQANTANFTISLPGASAAVKAAAQAAIVAVLLSQGSPGGVVDVSYVQAAIAAIPGTAGFVVTAESCDHGSISPTNGNINSNAGYLPVLGVITWA